MPTLNAMFKLMDGYSSQINKMINRTDEAMNKMLGTSKAADKTNDSFHKMGKGASGAAPKVKGLGDGLDVVSKKATRANGSLCQAWHDHLIPRRAGCIAERYFCIG